MGRIRVLVVDDSVVVRRLVAKALAEDAEIEVVGTAANGRIALAKVAQLAPDLVTLDIEMPEMDGLETLRHLRVSHPRLPVVMFSTLTERGAVATLDALSMGANDYVTKPAHVSGMAEALASVRRQLTPKIIALCPDPNRPRAAILPRQDAPSDAAAREPRQGPYDVLVIAASTGGPDALTAVLTALPADLPVPVVVVQHMPPVFTKMFSGRLNTKCALEVREAADGDVLQAGQVLVAPGDFHVVLQRRGAGARVSLNQTAPVNYCRPAADVLFRSAAELYGAGTLAVVLTGMGSDGQRGCAQVREAGGEVVVQDEASSVVWGMPGSVVAAGDAHRVLPLSGLAAHLLESIGRGRPGGVPPVTAAVLPR